MQLVKQVVPLAGRIRVDNEDVADFKAQQAVAAQNVINRLRYKRMLLETAGETEFSVRSAVRKIAGVVDAPPPAATEQQGVAEQTEQGVSVAEQQSEAEVEVQKVAQPQPQPLSPISQFQ